MLPQLAEVLPEEALAPTRKLRLTALALMGAHLEYEVAREPNEPVRKHMERIIELRGRFAEDIRPMVNRGAIDAEELECLRNTTGYQAALHDVALYCEVFRRHWPEIEARSYLSASELSEVAALVTRGFAMLGRREQSPVRASEAFLKRERAFTLFTKTYAEVRRLVQFLRNDITPSLHAGRNHGRLRGAPDDSGADGPSVVADPGQAPAPGTASQAAQTSPQTLVASFAGASDTMPSAGSAVSAASAGSGNAAPSVGGGAQPAVGPGAGSPFVA